MTEAVQRSRELFSSGFYCAESVLMAVAEALDVHCQLVPAIATGFCSGLARSAGPCGVLTSAVLAVNLALDLQRRMSPLRRATRQSGSCAKDSLPGSGRTPVRH